eukprot:tig00021525_g22142.t1
MSAVAELKFAPAADADHVVVIGKQSVLVSTQAANAASAACESGRRPPIARAAHAAKVSPQVQVPGFAALVQSASPGDNGDSLVIPSPAPEGSAEKVVKLAIGVVPTVCSRYNNPARADAVFELAKKCLPTSGKVSVILALEKVEQAFAAGCAVARALPLYSKKSKAPEKPGAKVHVSFVVEGGAEVPAAEIARVQAAADGIRAAAALVDTPTSEMHTDIMIEKAKEVASRVGADITIIRGTELRDKGFGGLWGVGKAATHPPALVILSHRPKDTPPKKTVCLVGKGIVYDTGGLSIKGTDGMCGMKRDMGGSAGVLHAFAALVGGGLAKDIALHCILCLAENAIGPEATRNDDILYMYSGKTVEINNTDAEGRLVLADGLAYAVKHLQPDVILDMATLTGAQGVATGQKHAAIIANDEELEGACVRAGRASGDLVHPLLYCPEFFRGEFSSSVADMKNSVKNRMNASSSCAAQFLADHLGEYAGKWVHVDMAYPVHSGERATGYGVALITELFGR